MNSPVTSETPLLSQEGWREAPGWFQSEILRECGFGTTPRVIASQSRCPPNLAGCGKTWNFERIPSSSPELEG